MSASNCAISGADTSALKVNQTTLAAGIGVVLLGGLIAMLAVMAVGACGLKLRLFSSPVAKSYPKLSSALEITYGELLALVGYFVAAALPVIISAASAQSLQTIANYVGKVVCLNLAVVVLPATRTSLWVSLFGISFERAVKYHRVVAWWTVASMWLHFLLFLIPAGTCVLDNSVGTNPPLYGLAATCIYTGTALLALEPIRRRWFELFRVSHVAFVVAYVFAVLHTRTTVWYCWLTAALYVCDWVLRVRRRWQVWGLVSASTHGPVTLLTLQPPSSFRYRAGQYCFVHVPGVSSFQWHPFSVVSAPSNGDRNVVFAIKNMGAGTWTQRLHAAVNARVTHNHGLEPLTVRVDGPLGVLSGGLSRYKRVVLIAGGIGATPILSILQHLRNDANVNAVEVVYVWVARDGGEFVWAAPILQSLTPQPGRDAMNASTQSLKMLLYATGEVDDVSAAVLPRVQRGRPNMDALIPMSNTTLQRGWTGDDCVVIASGPAGIVAKAQDIALQYGYDFKCESFVL